MKSYRSKGPHFISKIEIVMGSWPEVYKVTFSEKMGLININSKAFLKNQCSIDLLRTRFKSTVYCAKVVRARILTILERCLKNIYFNQS